MIVVELQEVNPKMSRKRRLLVLLRGLVAAALTACACLLPISTAAAGTFPTYMKQITLSGTTFSKPYGFAYRGTTYLPIWYVMQLANALHIQNKWNGQTRIWNFTDTAYQGAVQSPRTLAANAMAIFVGGQPVFQNLPRIVSQDPRTGYLTTYMPVYFIMQLFTHLGFANTWNGTQWNVQTPPPLAGTPTTGLPTLEGQTIPSEPLQNQAVSDVAYWQRASSSFFVSAQNTMPDATGNSDTSFVTTKPGQMLYLFAYDNNRSISATQTTWHVNSEAVVISNDMADSWTGGAKGYTQTLAYFTATKPGVYTVQAEANGRYSVPLVITVGLPNLKYQPFALPSADTGILPIPSALPATTAQSSGQVTFTPYPAQGNWIPVVGSVRSKTQGSVKAISVIFNGQSVNQEWDYRIPVDSSGHFAALLESPFTGDVSVSILKNYLTLMTQNSTNFSYTVDYHVQVNGSTPTATLQALLPSSAMDYNISPQFTQIADTLLENSPSLDTAIAAINNYAATAITYNNAELAPNATYVFQDALTTWKTQLGVCENIAQLSASLLRSVGIPTQTIGGYGNSTWVTPNYHDTNAEDAHEWLKIWDGTTWQLYDPTWIALEDKAGLGYGITSEFATATTSFLATHAQVNDQVATTM